MATSESEESNTFLPEDAPEGVLCQAYLGEDLIPKVLVMRDGDEVIGFVLKPELRTHVGLLPEGYKLSPITD